MPRSCWLILACCAASTAAQPPPDERQDAWAGAGFWPTQRMADLILQRVIDDFADEFELDDEQADVALEAFRARIPLFFNENRESIQRLTNEYLEAVMAGEAPAPEDVAIWATEVLPLMSEFSDQMQGALLDVREVMTDEQRDKLDLSLEEFRTGMGVATNRLQVWSEGGFDPDAEWFHYTNSEPRETLAEDYDAPMRDARARAEQRLAESAVSDELRPRAAPATQAVPSSRPAEPVDPWAEHVRVFCDRYELSAEQRQTARRFLAARQQDRDALLRRRGGEIERIQALFDRAKTPAELANARAQQEAFNAPVDKIFAKLSRQLETLPTRAQRKAADDRTTSVGKVPSP